MPDEAYYWRNSAGGCFLAKDLCCTKAEKYKNRILVSGWTPYNNGVQPYEFTGHSTKSSPISGRVACWIDNDGTNDFINSETHDIDYGGEIGFVAISLSFQYRDRSYAEPTYFQSYGCPSGTGVGALSYGILATNVPVFETKLEADDYILTGEGIEDALNYEEEEVDPQTTKTYHMYNMWNTGVQTHGEMTEGSQQYRTWRSIRVQCNRRPCLYFKNDRYELGVKYPDIVSWYGVTTPEDISEKEVSTFNNPPIIGYQTFYANINRFVAAKGYQLQDGTYTYGFRVDTDFAWFRTEEEAEYAIETGDYEEEIRNPYDPNNPDAPDVGDPEPETIWGGGSFFSPFIQTYVLSETALTEVADAFYTNDNSLLTNIKEGLELFGSEPFQAIVGLSAFPFDVTDIATTISDDHIYFGSYRHAMVNSVNRVTGLEADYIDAGSVAIYPLFNSYRDFEPYTSFHAYLPYVGWEKLQIEQYLNKVVNIRYYVDIYTRSAVCVLVADGVMQDYFPCSGLGVELPITGQNLSQYANETLNGLLKAGGGVVAGAVGGSFIPGVGTLVGAVGGGMLGASAAAASGVFQMSQKGKPKDHNLTKGSFSAATGNYLPQYVSFRWDVHEQIEPSNLRAIYGKPSSYSGKLSGLSGFVKSETMKLNTSGMSDAMIQEVQNLLSSGIYI